jgi:hypothetical protein
MIRLLLALYPARWRRRYGEEFRVVLESRPIGPFDVADILLGALDARLTRFRFAEPRYLGGRRMVLRIGGFGAVAGGILWFAGLAGVSAGLDGAVWPAALLLGTLGILVALAGLSAFQAHRSPKLVWAAFVIPALGTMLSMLGIAGMVLAPGDSPFIGSWSSWSVWFLGVVGIIVGSVAFGAATLRAAVLSRSAAIALATSSIVLMLVSVGLQIDMTTTWGLIVTVAVLGSFSGSWVALGAVALRRGPIRAVAPA